MFVPWIFTFVNEQFHSRLDFFMAHPDLVSENLRYLPHHPNQYISIVEFVPSHILFLFDEF